MTPTPPDHDCAWTQAAQSRIADLEAKVAELQHTIELHSKHRFGSKREKMATPDSELKKDGPGVDPAATAALRGKGREAKNRLPIKPFLHLVAPDVAACCPHCKAGAMRPLGKGEVTRVVEHIPASFVIHEHTVQKMVCPTCEHIETAKSSLRRFGEQSQYGVSVVADLVASKCLDAIPLYRLSARYGREGLRLHRSTMVDLFHRAATELGPLYAVLLARIASLAVVQADETVLKQQRGEKPGKAGNGWMWTFLADDGDHPLIAYRYSTNRSGATPVAVLGGTTGTLVVDAYTGYNHVTTPAGRDRAGCLAHARRYVFDARKTAGVVADRGLALILEAYRVEHEALQRKVVGTMEHLALRQTKGRAAMDAVKAWADGEQGKHLPKGPMGQALGYIGNHWKELTRYLDDVAIPIDNNRSEGALRGIALGRKNFLFVGHEHAGQNAAILYSMMATCVANKVNPEEWMRDVLLRVQTWPSDRVAELLPDRWRPQGALEPQPTPDEGTPIGTG